MNSAGVPDHRGEDTRSAGGVRTTRSPSSAPTLPGVAPPAGSTRYRGGYLQWRGMGSSRFSSPPGVCSAHVAAVRRDEDKGLVESWLSSGVSRLRLLATRSMFFAALSAEIVTVAGVAGWLGCVIAGTPADVAGLVGEAQRSGR